MTVGLHNNYLLKCASIHDHIESTVSACVYGYAHIHAYVTYITKTKTERLISHEI